MSPIVICNFILTKHRSEHTNDDVLKKTSRNEVNSQGQFFQTWRRIKSGIMCLFGGDTPRVEGNGPEYKMISRLKKMERVGETATAHKNYRRLPMLGYQAPAVQKAFQLLNTVAEARDGMRLTDISKGLGFSKGTTHGLIQALLKVGALYQSPFQKKVFLGASFVNLAIKSGHYYAITEQAQPLIDALCASVGQSVFLGVLNESGITVIATARAANSLAISSSPGSKIPFMAGAVSKAYLATLSNRDALGVIRENGFKKYTHLSIVDETDYLASLNTARLNGYAVDDGEYIAGVKSIAMSLDRFRNLPLLMWVIGFSSVMPEEKTNAIAQQMAVIAKKVKMILN